MWGFHRSLAEHTLVRSLHVEYEEGDIGIEELEVVESSKIGSMV